MVLCLAGCSLDPVYITAPTDDGTFVWAAPGSVLRDYQPVPIGPAETAESTFVCRAFIENVGFHGLHTGELRDQQCLISEYYKVWIFEAPDYQQLFARVGTPYRWVPLETFPGTQLITTDLYTNNNVHMSMTYDKNNAAKSLWFPCAAFDDGHWRGGKINLIAVQQPCYIAHDRTTELPVSDGIVVLYAPAKR